MEDDNEFIASQKRVLTRLQWKRFIVLALCFFPCFTAFRGLRDLQSTLNNIQGMGLASLAVLNTCAALAGLVVPAVVRLKIGTKWSFVIGSMLFIVYTASNYYASAYLLLPAAVLPGIGSAFLFVARGTMVTSIAIELAAANDRHPAAEIAFLTGIFSTVSRMSTLSGNAISSLVLNGVKSTAKSLKFHSVELGTCGRWACGGDSLGNRSALVLADQSSRNLLVSIYLGLGLLGLVIAQVFLERVPPKTAVTHGNTSTTKLVVNGMMSTLRLMKRPRMIMLIPSLIFYGSDMAFASGHFTKLFVGCTYGMESIGYVIMSLYGTCAVCSPLVGRLVKYTGRTPLFIVGAAVYLVLLITMLLWNPEEGRLWHLFAFSSGLGFCRAIMSTITLTLLGVLFSDQQESAFGNLCFWQSIGFASISALGIPESICGGHVIAIVISLLVVVVVLYIVLELNVREDGRRHGARYVTADINDDCDQSSDVIKREITDTSRT